MGLKNVHRIPYIIQLDKQNLIWIDLEMTGLDPEKEGNINDGYPLVKSFTFGINVGI